jgi:hypothetical protein
MLWCKGGSVVHGIVQGAIGSRGVNTSSTGTRSVSQPTALNLGRDAVTELGWEAFESRLGVELETSYMVYSTQRESLQHELTRVSNAKRKSPTISKACMS